MENPPPQQAMGGAAPQSSGVTIEVLQRENLKHVRAIGQLKYHAFGSKACCLCFYESESQNVKNSIEIYSDVTKCPDEKLKLCAIALSADADSSSEDARVLGFIQLDLHGLGGDPFIPVSCLQHTCKIKECHVDQIAVGPAARGKGVGTKLLNWADETAKQYGCDRITLDVVFGNPAKGLYERQGYVVDPTGAAEACCISSIVFCAMKKRGVYGMTKRLL